MKKLNVILNLVSSEAKIQIQMDFDMKQMLAAFDGDAEKLANAFASQLNNELASRKNERLVREAAEDVANAWNDFVEEYFTYSENVPDDTCGDDYIIDANSVIDLMKTFLRIVPALTKYSKDIEDFNALFHNNKQKAKEVGAQVRDDFSATMNKFFDKMGW